MPLTREQIAALKAAAMELLRENRAVDAGDRLISTATYAEKQLFLALLADRAAAEGPGVEAVKAALADVMALVDDGLLVRNTTNDAHFPSYAAEAIRLVKALAAAKSALGAAGETA